MSGIEVNHKKLKELLSICRATKFEGDEQLPPFIKGKTGIGKSVAVVKDAKEYAESIGREFVNWVGLSKDEKIKLIDDDYCKKFHIFVDVRTALLEPTDLMGLPLLNGTEYVEWKPTLLFRVLSNPNISATLFFDELNLGSRMVINSIYQVVYDKAIGETKLGKDVFIISAGNSVDDRANINETPMPLNNRFFHATLVVPTAEEWIEYNLQSDFAEPRICSFLHRIGRHYIHSFTPDRQDEAFSTPRTLERCAMKIKLLDTKKDIEKIEMVATGLCGGDFGNEFSRWLELQNTLDVDEIMKNPKLVAEHSKLDERYAIISGCSIKVRDNFKTNIEPSLKVANELTDEEAVFMFRLIMELVKPATLKNYLKGCDFWFNTLSKKIGEVLGNW